MRVDTQEGKLEPTAQPILQLVPASLCRLLVTGTVILDSEQEIVYRVVGDKEVKMRPERKVILLVGNPAMLDRQCVGQARLDEDACAPVFRRGQEALVRDLLERIEQLLFHELHFSRRERNLAWDRESIKRRAPKTAGEDEADLVERAFRELSAPDQIPARSRKNGDSFLHRSRRVQ